MRHERILHPDDIRKPGADKIGVDKIGVDKIRAGCR